MGRNLALQILRGPQAHMPALADGEFYYAEDFNQLWVGFSGGTFRVGNAMAIQLSDGTITTQLAHVDANNDLHVAVDVMPTTPVTLSGNPQVQVSNLPATQPVSAVALPLPANAAQETGGNLAAISAAQTNLTNGTQKSQIVNSSGSVADVQAKGVQGTLFLQVAEAKDVGRSKVILSLTKATSITTEALVTLTQKKGDA